MALVDIYLDDNRETPPGYLRAYSVEECKALLIKNAGRVGILSLDNDLGFPGIENEGRAVCNWLAETLCVMGVNFWPEEKVVIHSANPVARDYMAGVIVRYGGFRQVAPHVFTRDIWE